MAKLRFIAVVLLVAMASLSVGFARTERFPIAATVETGALEVDLVGTAVEHDGYVTAEKRMSNDNREVIFTIERMYPGAAVMLHLKAVNTGNLSVVFDNALLTWEGDLTLAPYIELISGFQYDGDGDGDIDGGESVRSSWERVSNTASAMNGSASLRNMVLRPTGAFYLGTPVDGAVGSSDYPLTIRLSPDAPNETQDTTVTFKLVLNWKQSISNEWTGDVEIRWRKVTDENGKGWDVIGDVYLIRRDGTWSLYKTNWVRAHFSGQEAPEHKTGNFKVQLGSIQNHYQVDIHKSPPIEPEIVHPHS